MPHAIIRGENGRRHKVNFGDAAVRVGIHPRDRRDLHRGGFRDDPRRASALRPSEHSPPPVQRSPCRGGTTCHKYSYYILDVVRNSDISAELAPASSREEKPFKVRWPSRLGEPVPSIGYIGRMTILHPGGWLACHSRRGRIRYDGGNPEDKRRASPCSRSGDAEAHSTSRKSCG